MLERYNQWVNFQGIKVPGQIGIINNRPVYHTTGSTLKDQIKSCSKKRGSLVEFTSDDEQSQLTKIMKDTEQYQILIFLNFEHDLLLWPSSGAAFPYPLDATVVASTFKGMVSYKCYDKTTKADVNQFAIVTTIGSLKTLCHAHRNDFYEDADEFKKEVSQKIKLAEQDGPLSDLITKVRKLLANKTTTPSTARPITEDTTTTNTTPLATTTTTQPPLLRPNKPLDKCWPLLVQVLPTIRLHSVKPAASNKKLQQIKLQFQHFMDTYKLLKASLRNISKTIPSYYEIDPTLTPMSSFANFMAHIDLNKPTYLSILVLSSILLFTIVSTLSITYCYRREKNKPPITIRQRVFNTIEEIPLALRREPI